METESGRETIIGHYLQKECPAGDERAVYFRTGGVLYPIKTITVEKPNNLSQKSYLVLDDGTYVQTEKEDLSTVLKPGDTLDLGVDSLFVCELVNVCKSIFFTTSGAFMCQVRLPDGQMTIMQLTQEQIERYKR